jgi:hypothetical protein
MHKLTPTIEEVIALTMWLSDKQFQQNFNSGLCSHLWTLETIFSPAPKFMQIFTLIDYDIRNKFYFGSGLKERGGRASPLEVSRRGGDGVSRT